MTNLAQSAAMGTGTTAAAVPAAATAGAAAAAATGATAVSMGAGPSGNSSTTPAAIVNWIEWLDSRDSATFINQKAQEQLFQEFAPTITADECKRKLLDHHETLFLFKENFGNRVNVFHHMIEIGSTVYEPSVQIGFIQGVGTEVASVMTPDATILCEPQSSGAVHTPTVTNILNVTSITDIDALSDGSLTYKPRNFIPVTPFLCQTVSESVMEDQGCGKEMLLKLVNAIKAFDVQYSGNTDYCDKAQQKCKDVLYWVYLACQGNGAIKAVPTAVCHSARIRRRLREETD